MIYFGAGIWPEEGVYVSAVDAETGRLLWRSDSMSYVKDGMSDQRKAYDLSLPPQGYLTVIDGRLAVPSGRSLAAWFDTATGAMEPYTCFYVKHNPPRGTWHLSGINQFSVQGGNWFGTRASAMPPLPSELEDATSALYWSNRPPENERYVIKNRPFLRADTYLLHPENRYTDPILTDWAAYASEFVDQRKYLVPRGHTHVSFPEYDRIVARDLTGPQWKSTLHMHVAHGKRTVKMPKLEFPILWELKSPLSVLIKAGNQLYAGGKDTIAAIAIPEKGEEPKVVWQEKVDGVPVHALVADEKLVLVTHNGNVYAFGTGSGQKRATPAPAAQRNGPYRSPQNGYALLFGYGDGTLAKTLAGDDGYRVVVLEPDPAKATAARAALAQDRLYGRPTERNYVAAVDQVYVVTGEMIHVYDSVTGRQVNTIGIPPQLADRAHTASQEPQEQRYMGYRATIQAAPSWTEVRLWEDLLLAMVAQNLIAVDRYSGAVRWSRPSTRETTTYALGNDTLFGLDHDVPPMGGGRQEKRSGLLFALNPRTGEITWQTRPEYAPVPKHEEKNPRIWHLPLVPELAYNAKHGLLVMTVNRNSLHVFHAADGEDGELRWDWRIEGHRKY